MEHWCEGIETWEQGSGENPAVCNRSYTVSTSSPSPSSSLSHPRGLIPLDQNIRFHNQTAHSHETLWLRELDPAEAAARVREDRASIHSRFLEGPSDFNHLQVVQNSRSPNAGEESSGYHSNVEREHMFDKVVTPSDVGKLNRLVIPKQHAEKYFPLDASGSEKGLLLCFEDRSGKPWRFRYSYWNSSQSYVMTKGWSRFVKEKKLDAGDIVSFERGVGEFCKDRMYIDWRRRPEAAHHASPLHGLPLPYPSSFHRSSPWGPVFYPPTVSAPLPHMQMQHLNYDPSDYSCNANHPSPMLYPNPLTSSHGATSVDSPGGMQMLIDTSPTVAAPKRFRLFGVNLECNDGRDDETHPMSLVAALQPQQHAQFPPLSSCDPVTPVKPENSLPFDFEI